MLGDIAVVFHFQPSELWEMDIEELAKWHVQARRSQ